MNKETYFNLYLSEQEITEFVKSNRHFRNHQDIIENLGLSSHYYLVLKRLFPHLPKNRSHKYPRLKIIKSKLANVDLLVVRSGNKSRTHFLEPPFWDAKREKPKIYIDYLEIAKKKLEIGDKILVRIKPKDLTEPEKKYLRATFIRVIEPKSKRGLGIVRMEGKETSICTAKKFFTKRNLANYPDLSAFKDGDIVEIDIRDNKQKSKVFIDNISKVHGSSKKPDLFSFLAKKEFSLKTEFPDSVHKELCAIIQKKEDTASEDLTHIPFVTIDPINARDKDDAVYAEFPEINQEKGIFCEIWIAIADVSFHVTAGSSIDQEALRRGNSTYFFDSVVPMLPEKLSNDLCSLEENKVRNSITLRITLNKHGKKINHKFIKSRILVKHNCSYKEVENSYQKSKSYGTPDNDKQLLFDNLFKANLLLTKSIPKALNLNIPEPIFNLSAKGDVISLFQEKALKSHKMVENFMITANTCVAETLSESQLPVIYRVHESPPTDRLTKLLQRISFLGIKGNRKRNIKSGDFNQILNFAKASQFHDITSLLVLQAMTQAYYTITKADHFGLDLKKYMHFTSPIRRYTDLLTHRLLKIHLGWSTENIYQNDTKSAELICLHLNTMEKNSAMAERQSNSRYIASFMQSLVGKSFEGLVCFSTKEKIIFFLRQFGIQGVCNHKGGHEKTLKRRKRSHRKDNELIKIGNKIKVKLMTADTLSGDLSFELE